MTFEWWFAYLLTSIILSLSPGSGAINTMTTSINHGYRGAAASIAGLQTGLGIHIVLVGIGLGTLFSRSVLAFEVLKWAGAAYLMWMAWQAVRPGARSLFEPRQLAEDSPRRLFLMGFLTNLLNPKIAVFYLSVFPQFVSPGQGSVFLQSIILGVTQIAVSFSINLLIALFAASIAAWFAENLRWIAVQRYVMGFVLAGLAVRLILEPRRGA